MSLYKGKEECVGCGKSGTESPRRRVKSLCYDCRQLLEIGRKQKHILDLYNPKNFINLNFREFKLKNYRSGISETLNNLTYALIKSLRTGVYISGAKSANDGTNATSCAWIRDDSIRKDHYKAIKTFFEEMESTLEEYIGDENKERNKAYESGYKDGENLLMRLNKDDQFNSKIYKKTFIK